jgi:hypothetical protein
MKRLIFCVLAILLQIPLALADVSVTTSVEKKAITVGDPIHYTVTLNYPASMKLTFPEKPSELGLWSVSGMKINQPQTKSGISSQDIVYSLISFSTGAIEVPSITYSLADASGAASTVATSTTTITVESILDKYGDKGDIRDIKPPLALINLWPFIILLLILAIAGIWYYVRQKKLAADINLGKPVVPARPPHEVALEELDKLEHSGLVAEGRIKEFYIAMADIVRTYLGAAYGIETMDRTTAEIFSQLRTVVKDLKITMPVHEFFDNCDLVKFAKYRPGAPECAADLDRARAIVNLIIPLHPPLEKGERGGFEKTRDEANI